jgi:large subunit ribosomal protein L23
MDHYEVILEPVITEKATDERVRSRYVFKVSPRSTKIDVKNAVENVFKVKVLDVNTVAVKGKVRGAIRGSFGRTKSWKKAYVTLAAGQKIESLEA